MKISNKNGEYKISFDILEGNDFFIKAGCLNEAKEKLLELIGFSFDYAIDKDGIHETINEKKENNIIVIRWREHFEQMTKILIDNGYTIETSKIYNGFLIKIIK